MNRLEIPSFITSEFINELASNKEVLNLILEAKDREIVIDTKNLNDNDQKKVILLKFLFCDVKINNELSDIFSKHIENKYTEQIKSLKEEIENLRKLLEEQQKRISMLEQRVNEKPRYYSVIQNQ